MDRIWLIIDKIDKAISNIPIILAGIAFAIGLVVVILPVIALRLLSLGVKLLMGHGFNEMAFDSSHPEFNVSMYIHNKLGG